MTFDEMLTASKKKNNPVLKFIDKFYAHAGTDPDKQEVLRYQFRAGYCYYFAVMLKAAFKRGEVCWCAPFGHFCWVDIDGCPYDVEGVYLGEADYFIPENYLGDAINDFLHTGVKYCATKKEINQIIANYLAHTEE